MKPSTTQSTPDTASLPSASSPNPRDMEALPSYPVPAPQLAAAPPQKARAALPGSTALAVTRALGDLPYLKQLSALQDSNLFKMNRAIEDSLRLSAIGALQNSHAMAAVRAFEDSTAISAIAKWQDSSMLAAIRNLEDSALFKALAKWQDSSLMAAMRTVESSPFLKTVAKWQASSAFAATHRSEDSPFFAAMTAIKESPALNALETLQGSPLFKAMAALEDSPALAMMRTLKDSPVFKAFSGMPTQAGQGVQWDSIARTLVDNDLFRTIATADKQRLEALFSQAETNLPRFHEAASVATGRGAFTKGDASEVAEELRLALSAGPSSKPLSAGALLYLARLIMCLWMVYQAVAQWPAFQAGACDLQARLLTLEARQNIRKFTKGLICEIPRETLRSMRYVDRAGVPLYLRPAVRSQVVARLPKGAVLIVLDDTDRNWLYVQFSQDDVEADGWVSRKFVRRFVE
ncbi:SH3 domain-containing protein [Cupriavidus gilardii]|uniref:SH3 domain-containing protein n=1 Tax=Cupriavidus gilardii TaxID=82541 RepID=UPI0015811753|nr:SH3 domain-containing protein [Cupriavidus gilardii]MCG5262747.1 SH3 domain-containing protein [Cupriavidus gilardii]QKS63629.1 SH3 domain-containing protein [Cupriavidus gilardii]